MDQLSAVTDISINHGLSVGEAIETAASVVSAMQAKQVTEIIDTIFDKAMSFWLITSSSR